MSIVAGVLAALVGAGVALTSDVSPANPGAKAPGFMAVRVTTGDTVSLSDYAGTVILLNVWATWCLPCEKEMPSMQRLHETLGSSGLKVVAVSIDESTSEHVRDWARERNLTFEILHDRRGTIQRTYQTTGVPESFIIDRHGTIVKRVIGAYEWDQPAVISTFRRLLSLDVETQS